MGNKRGENLPGRNERRGQEEQNTEQERDSEKEVPLLEVPLHSLPPPMEVDGNQGVGEEGTRGAT